MSLDYIIFNSSDENIKNSIWESFPPNLNFTINSDMFKVSTKLKKSSLESDLYQPYDRYYMKLDFNDNFNDNFNR